MTFVPEFYRHFAGSGIVSSITAIPVFDETLRMYSAASDVVVGAVPKRFSIRIVQSSGPLGDFPPEVAPRAA